MKKLLFGAWRAGLVLLFIGSIHTVYADVILYEDFSDGAIPAGWSTTLVQGDHVWTVVNDEPFTSSSGGHYAVFHDEALTAVVTPNESVLNLPIVDCSGRTSVKLRYEHYWQELENSHGTVEVSGNGGGSWTTLVDYELGTQGSLGFPQETIFDISLLAAGQSEVMVRFRYDDGGQAGKYWYLDDIYIYSDPDVGVTDLVVPDHLGCSDAYTATESVSIEVTNFSFEEVANVPVVVEVSGGASATFNVVVAGPIPGQSSVMVSMPGTIDMSPDAVYDFNCYTNLASDTYVLNDNHYESRQQVVTTYPYLQNFNGTEGGWWAYTDHESRSLTHGPIPYLISAQDELDSWYCSTSGTNTSYVFLESPVFDLSSVSDAQLSFDVKHHLHLQDYFQVQWSTNGGANWIQLGTTEPDWYNAPNWWRNSLTDPADEWTSVHIDLCHLVGNSCVKFRVRGRPRHPGSNAQFAIDNAEITTGGDVGVTSFLSPVVDGCLFSSDQEVTVRVYNYSCSDVSDVPITCDVSNAITASFSETISGPIPAGGYIDYTFSTTVDMTGLGTYELDVHTQLVGDVYAANDHHETSIDVNTITVSSYPYLEDFNADDGTWIAGFSGTPTNNGRQFTYGAFTYLNGPELNGDCWFVEADGDHNNTWIRVESPVFDFSELTQPTLSMDIKHQLNNQDYFQVEVSVNGGNTWTDLGAATDPNWYNAGVWWRGSNTNPVDEWTTVTQDLCELSGEPCVRFRVHGRPRFGNPGQDHFAFDNFSISAGVDDDVEVMEIILSNAGDCSNFGTDEPLAIILRNHGCRPLTDVPVSFQLDGGPLVNEIIPGPIPEFGFHTYTFSNTLDLSPIGSHHISVTTNLPSDLDPSNDHVERSRLSTTGINSYPYLEDFNADNGGWASRTTTATRHFNWGEVPYLGGSGTEGNSMYCETYVSNNNGVIWMESPVFDFSGLVEPQFSMDVKYQLHLQDYFKVQSSINGGSSWQDIEPDRPNWTNAPDWWRNNSGAPVNEWTKVHHSVCDLAGEPCVKFRVYGRPKLGYPAYVSHGNFAVDNIEIQDGPDVAVTEYLGPVDVGCLFATDELVTVEVSNFGCFPVENIPITCTVTGSAASVLVGTVPGPIPAGGSVDFTFPTGFDMTVMGAYQFSTTVSHAGDIFSDNDNLITTINVNTLKVTTYPYHEDFNSGTGFWIAGFSSTPTNESRQFTHGEIPYLGGPVPGDECWFVEAEGTSNNTWIRVESPVFDFSEVTRPILSMDIKHQLNNQDYFQMEVSIDGGASWTDLGSATDPNWYNAGVWWRSSQTTPVSEWTNVSQNLCELSGEDCVKFRIHGRPRFGGAGQDYFAFDNFHITAGDLDELETKEMMLSDGGDCSGFGATEPVSVILRNNRCRPLTNVPIQLQVDGGAVINEVMPGPINPFSNYYYTFSNTVDLSGPGTHSITINTALATDEDLTNNEITRTRERDKIGTYPYLEDFNSDNGGWTARRVNTSTRFFTYDTVPYLNGSEGEDKSWHVETNTSNDGNPIYLESPVFDFSSLSSPQISFDLKHSLNHQDYYRFYVSTNGGSTWTHLGEQQTNWYNHGSHWWRDSHVDPVDEWTKYQHDLCDYAGNSCVKFRIYGRSRFGDPQYPNYGRFAIDNISIEESIDLGIVAQVSPVDEGCLFTDEEFITIEVFNYISTGCAPVFNVPVTVEITGEVNQTLSGIVPGPIPVGGSVDFTFATPIDMTGLGNYEFQSYTEHALDLDYDNDTLTHSINVTQYTVNSFPYIEDFNADNGLWIASGGNDRDFVYGEVPYLGGAEDAVNSWYVDASGNNNNQWITLESPVFDFTDVENPRMFFDIKHQLNNQDYFRMEVSTNGGATWTHMLSPALPHWYNTVNWWRNSIGSPVNEWTSMYQDLCDQAGESCVKYRFKGRPRFGTAGNYYLAIDNFRITDTEIDAQIMGVNGCWGSEYSIDVTFRNMNDLCEVPDAINSITVGYELDGAPAIEHVYAGLNVLPNATETLNVPNVNVPTLGSSLKVWVTAPNGLIDHIFDNDTLEVDISNWPNCNDHCSNSIEVGFGTTTASQTSNATIDVTEDPLFAGCGALSIENTVWYHFTTNEIGGEVQVDFHDFDCTPNDNGVQVSIVEINGTACDPMNYTEIFCSDLQTGNDFSFGPELLPPTTTYYIGIDGVGGNDCDFLITIAGSVTSNEVDPPTTSDLGGCTGPFDLEASGSTGNYRWYDSFIGGTLLSTDNPYSVSPLVTTTYYVAAIDGLGIESNRVPAVVTIEGSTDPRLWNGSIDIDWHTDANWSCGGVPDQTVNVFIPDVSGASGNYPSVTAVGFAKDITIDVGSRVDLELGSSLEIAGNWINNGEAELGDGTVIFNGGVPQTLNGLNIFGGLNLNNIQGLSVESGTQQVNIKLELEEGELITNGLSFIINSDEFRTAYINDFTPGFTGTIAGDVTVERYISNAFQAYHYIGSPVDGATIEDWNDDYGVAPWGFSNDGDQIIPTSDCNPDLLEAYSPFGNLFDYREDQVEDCYLDGWHVRLHGPLTNGMGFSAMLPNTTLLDVTGPATTGDITVGGLTRTNAIGNGFNLLSNPFPSNINWQVVSSDPTNDNFSGSCYIWMASGQYAGTYQAINGFLPSPYLPSSQAFFVQKADPGVGSFLIPQNSRVEGDHPFAREASKLVSRLSLSFESEVGNDLVHLLLSEEFSSGYDRLADADKVVGLIDVPTISIIGESGEMAINGLSPNDLPDRIPLQLNIPESGDYVFHVDHFSQFPDSIQVFLEDSKANELYGFTEGRLITFNLKGDDHSRFNLLFRIHEGVDTQSANEFEPEVFVNGNNLFIDNLGGQSPFMFNLIDMSGRSIISGNLTKDSKEVIDISHLATGAYMVNLVSPEKQFYTRVSMVK